MEGDTMNRPTDGVSFYQYRWNIVPFGVIGHRLASHFADSLDAALMARKLLESIGAEDVRVYDTVDGLFY